MARAECIIALEAPKAIRVRRRYHVSWQTDGLPGEGAIVSKLRHVNSTDIRAAIELGCRTMSSDFNADDNDIPFFGSTALPEARLSFSEIHSESHVPGRHLNALLNAEDAAGISVPEAAVARHERAALYSYSGSIPLPLNRTHIGGPLINFT